MKLRNGSALSILLARCALVANPQYPAVISGDASFEIRSPEVLEIVASDRSIIEWSDFSIDVGETTRFIQPNEKASVLNRVLEATPSRLMGNLESNGQVLLINPNGIVVGKEAQIHTGSFIASSLDIHNEMFLNQQDGEFFTAGEGSILNYGHVEAMDGDVLFLGLDVANEGTVVAKNGSVAMLGGTQVRIPLTRKICDAADNHFDLAFRYGDSPAQVLQNGAITANHAVLLGERVDISGSIDVSGPFGGGSILIGGDYQGGNPAFQNARLVYQSSDSNLKADSLRMGDGGKIILWSDEWTESHGSLSAQGGSLGGDGGLLEVSGKYLNFDANPCTLAAFGKAGTLLLDPIDIVISSSASANVNNTPNGPNFSPNGPCPPPPVSNLSNANLNHALTLGNVMISTVGTVGVPSNACPGNVTFDQTANISWINGFNLTVNAAGSIIVNGEIVNTAGPVTSPTTGNITFTAANNVTIQPLTNVINSAYFGTQNGTTTVNGTIITLMGGTGGVIREAYIGAALLPATSVVNGPIVVNATTLNLLGGDNGAGNAIIGHTTFNSMNMTSNCSASITLNITGAINLTAAAGSAVIGHGTHSGNAGGNPTFEGNICITGNSLTQSTTAGDLGVSTIGHTELVSGQTALKVDADITLNIGAGGITFTGNSATGQINIGHNRSGATTTCNGNIQLFTSGDIAATGTGNFFIGQQASNQTTNGNSNILISCNNFSIGTAGVAATFNNNSHIGNNIATITGGIIDILANGAFTYNASTEPFFIGNLSTTAPTTANLNIAVGGNGVAAQPVMSINSTGTPEGLRIIGVNGDVNVAVGGDIQIAGHGVIATENVASGFTRIYASGNITTVSTFPFGEKTAVAPVITPAGSSLDVRAGKNLTMDNAFATTLTGGITLGSGVSFKAGDLFTIASPALSSICCDTFSFACPAGTACCAGACTKGTPCCLFLNCSSATACPQSGAICSPSANCVCATPNCAQAFNATSACSTGAAAAPCAITIPIKLASSAKSTGTTCSALALNHHTFQTVDGDVRVLGTCDGACTMNQPIIVGPNGGDSLNLSITGTGNLWILGIESLKLDQDLNISGGITIGVFGKSTAPTLKALDLNGHIIKSTGAGSVQISSATDLTLDTAPTAVQTNTGSIVLLANNNINATTNITSTSGGISSCAGNNTTVTKTISTAGSILMLSGVNMTMAPTSSIQGGGTVTLVVDNDNPVSPLIGSGAFFMNAGSTITSIGALQIFTALQNLNAIQGLLNGQAFTAGPLFNDSATEEWCTYYPSSIGGSAFTIFYKNCFPSCGTSCSCNPTCLLQGFLFDLITEFPGWEEGFSISYQPPLRAKMATSSLMVLPEEKFMLRRRLYSVLNQPKSWTHLLPE